MKSHSRLRTVDLAYLGLFAALMAICAWISVPMPAPLVPFTLQTFAIFAAVTTLGGRRGTYAVGVYLLLGLVGAAGLCRFFAAGPARCWAPPAAIFWAFSSALWSIGW